jgi:hypothetical protein
MVMEFMPSQAIKLIAATLDSMTNNALKLLPTAKELKSR